jgi:hypothetical protein
MCGGNELAGEGLTPTHSILDPTYVNSTQKIAKCVIKLGKDDGQTLQLAAAGCSIGIIEASEETRSID